MTDSLDLLRDAPSDATIAVTSPLGEERTYQQLRGVADVAARAMASPRKCLVAVAVPRSLTGLGVYLAALREGHAVTLLESRSSQTWRDVIARFRPDHVVTGDGGVPALDLPGLGYAADPLTKGAALWSSPPSREDTPIHPELAQLLRTSGSTGEPRFVRLSYSGLSFGARTVASVLEVSPCDRVMACLPMDYVFGLSLATMALVSGAALVLTARTASSGELWNQVSAAGGSVVAATPPSYLALRAQRWQASQDTAVRLLLSAGGGLDTSTWAYFRDQSHGLGWQFLRMYGQTEAGGRIATETVTGRGGEATAVGRPLPGVTVRIDARTPDRAWPGTGRADGEIVVQTPAVMLGYAASRADLSRGTTQGSELRTGDVGYLRGEELNVVGRLDREVKVWGRRVSLDEVEAFLAERGHLVLATSGTDQLLSLRAVPAPGLRRACEELAERLEVPRGVIDVHPCTELPMTESGKPHRGPTAVAETGTATDEGGTA